LDEGLGVNIQGPAAGEQGEVGESGDKAAT